MTEEILKSFERKWKEKYGEDLAHDNYAFYYVSKMVEESILHGLAENAKAEIALNEISGYTPLERYMHDTACDLDQFDNYIYNMDIKNKKKKAETYYFVLAEHLRKIRKDMRDRLTAFYASQKST